ncbi:predicted protein [Chaetoceros tenuissimus]|uniref:Uncharacterized protein n=1 Tax=Chaetoceros tenuissimus TaxID=426638 RepID=A0AAD3H854_9STRA|nr:predicted protein [Chaetoceros tenuissimus]
MKESKQYVQRNASNTFSSRNNPKNDDSNWTSSRQGLQPNNIEVTRTKAPSKESLHQMRIANQDQGQSSRFHMVAKRSLNLFVGGTKSTSFMKKTKEYKKNPYQDSVSPWYMLQKETFQHIQPPTIQNEISNAKGKKEQSLNDLSSEQRQANHCHVSAYYSYDDVQTRTRGEKNKKELVADNDSNDQTTDTSFKNCSFSPTPGRFNLNDVEGDLPADFPDFSPLPYDEYANASKNNGWTMPPQQHCAASNGVKRQKTHEMANKPSLGLPTFPRRSDYVTFLKEEAYHTHNACHHDEQSIIQLLKEERKQQHEYLPATLNFPYKDFIASTNNKTNESHLQLWCDEEEQSRLEKHFNPKWQVEFFSKFYTACAALETPDIFGPSKTISSEKDDSHDCSIISASTTATQSEDDEIVFVSMTSNAFKNPSSDNLGHSNVPQNKTCTSPSTAASRSDISHHSTLLEQTAIKLSAAMDDTDKTRDIITRIEKEMQVNRDEMLKKLVGENRLLHCHSYK